MEMPTAQFIVDAALTILFLASCIAIRVLLS